MAASKPPHQETARISDSSPVSDSDGARDTELGDRESWIALVVAASLLAVGVAGLFTGPPFWWVAWGLLATSFVLGAAALKPQLGRIATELSRPASWGPFRFRPTERIWGIVCVGVIVVLATVMLREPALGDPPISRDHTAQMVNVWQTGKMLALGRLHGWSNHLFGGYPVNYHYPLGVGLWVYGVKWASLGLLSLTQAYGVSFWLFWILCGYAVYRVGRQFFNRWVGLLAAITYMTDSGSFRGGGWSFAVYWGVWPQSLAVAMMAMAVSYVPDMLRSRDWRHVAAFGFWSGFSLLTHPTMLVPFVIVVPLALVALWRTSPKAPLVHASWRAFVGLAIGAVIGSAYFGPYFAAREYSASYGHAGKSAYDYGVDFVDTTAIPALWTYVEVLAVVGIIAGLLSRRFGPLFNVLVILCLLGVFGQTFVDEFHLSSVAGLFESMQYQRFTILVKPYLFVAAASVPVLAVQASRSRFFGGTSLVARAVVAGVVVFVLAPIAVGFGGAYNDKFIDREVQTASERDHLEERRELVPWIKANLPQDEFYRLAIMVGGDDHRFLDLGTELDVPIYQAGFAPSSAFKHNSTRTDTRSLKAHNVRYALSFDTLKSRDFVLLKKFKSIGLYEFKHWEPDIFKVTSGSGDVKLTHFDDERVDLIAAPGAHGRLRLNITNFPRWKATRDGVEIPIGTEELRGNSATAFISVPLEPGEYSFRYQLGAVEQLPRLLLPLALLFALALTLADLRRKGLGKLATAMSSVGERFQRLASRHRRSATIALAAAGIACFGASLAIAARDIPLEPLEGGRDKIDGVVFDFLEELPEATVDVQDGDSVTSCTRRIDRFVCRGGTTWGHVAVRSVPIESYSMYRCISAHPPEKGALTITYDDVPLGDGLVGFFGVANSGHATSASPIDFDVLLDGVEVFSGKVSRKHRRQWLSIPASGTSNVTFRVSTNNADRKHFCFYAQTVVGELAATKTASPKPKPKPKPGADTKPLIGPPAKDSK